jgi:uncharacterized NAD-dependent epimerase/dehydratase family protein
MDGTAIILTNGFQDQGSAKTAHGLVRSTDRYAIKAVIDPQNGGKDAGELLDGRHRNIPVFDHMTALPTSGLGKIDFAVIGIATKGGIFPRDMQPTVEAAIRQGISIVSGLHEYLGDIPELADLARQHQVQIIDIRRPKPKSQLHFWTGNIRKVTCPRVAVLGTDCNLGKRTTTRFLVAASKEAGLRAEMIYTGQTGWMQGGKYGFVFDSTYNDFVSGEVEHALVSCFEETHPDVIFIEGQSSLRNPSGPCGSEFLVSGQAQAVVLQHAPGRRYYQGFEHTQAQIPSLKSEIALIRMYGAQTLAVTLNTSGLDKRQILRYKIQYEDELGIPVVLPLEEGVDTIIPLIKTLAKHHRPTEEEGGTAV